MANIIPK